MSRRPQRAVVILLCAALLGLTACSTDQNARAAAPVDPPTREVRSGVPLLMDIPIFGFFFGRRRVER